jgi:Fic family protein
MNADGTWIGVLDKLWASIVERKGRLDALRPLSGPALVALQKSFDVDLTYTSNAIEGNTLTLRETAEVIEHGITVGGKSLRDHLEAVDHYNAVLWMRALAGSEASLGEATVRELHRRIVFRSQAEIGGVYSTLPRRIAGSPAVFPRPLKIRMSMKGFWEWLEEEEASATAGFVAHYRLLAIHPFGDGPFGDGNGRTARLLMNLLLIRGGYPPIAVRPEDRKAYVDALEVASVREDTGPFLVLMHERLNDTLAEYLRLLEGEGPTHSQKSVPAVELIGSVND